MGIKETDREAELAATSPNTRVSLNRLEREIASIFYLTGQEAATAGRVESDQILPPAAYLESYTICMVVMRNGYTVVGTSAPADPKNFNAALGRKLAYEDAARRIWPVLGYEMRTALMKSGQ